VVWTGSEPSCAVVSPKRHESRQATPAALDISAHVRARTLGSLTVRIFTDGLRVL